MVVVWFESREYGKSRCRERVGGEECRVRVTRFVEWVGKGERGGREEGELVRSTDCYSVSISFYLRE